MMGAKTILSCCKTGRLWRLDPGVNPRAKARDLGLVDYEFWPAPTGKGL